MKAVTVDGDKLNKAVIFLVEKTCQFIEDKSFCEDCPAKMICLKNDGCCQMAWHIYLKDSRWKKFWGDDNG